jgi:antitoxin component of MazEF toxin-antitoxin module
MLAKMTSKNQVTLPKAVVSKVALTNYFDVEVEGGRIILTPVRIQKADAVRNKLAALGIDESDAAEAVAWARGRK